MKIGKGFDLPEDYVTQTGAILAKRGAGKTYLALVLVEELVRARLPVVVLDPVGVCSGLRLAADGKRPGLDVVILGGERGDIPLEATAGKVVAAWIVESRRACVLDLSNFRKSEQRRFVEDLISELYRKNREPLHVVLDEADLFAPQRPMPGEQAMLGAVEDLVRRGRARGLGVTLVTQRPAVLHKDVLTQVDNLVVLRMLGPQDRAAIETWIKFHGSDEDRKRVLGSLASLPIGTAWWWSPGWLGVLERIEVRKRRTFDSSATPTAGGKKSRRARVLELPPVDLGQLRDRFAETVARVKNEDPKILRKRVAELEREVSKLRSAKPATTVERVEVPVFPVAAKQALDRAANLLFEVEAAVAEIVAVARAESGKTPRTAAPRKPATPRPIPSPVPAAPPNLGSNGSGSLALPKAERGILTALAQHGALSLKQAALIAGYSAKSGGMRNAAGALRSASFASGGNDRLEITDAGLAALGSWDPLPTGPDLAAFWYAKLPKAEREILRVVVDAYPDPVSLTAAAEANNYAPSSGGMRNAAGRLRTLDLVEGGNAGMRAHERLVR